MPRLDRGAIFHALEPDGGYAKIGAENFTTVTINKSIIKSFSGFHDWIYR